MGKRIDLNKELQPLFLELFYRMFPRGYKFYRKAQYELFSRLVRWKDKDITFINYGYGYLKPSKERPKLSKAGEKNRYSIQLYNHLASLVTLKDKDIMEVGSGRGGGLNYVFENHKAKSAKGVDLAHKAIEFCNSRYTDNRINFVQGDAENLPLEDSSFDAVLNVESSNCYPDVGKFYNEVYRVLRDKGKFLYTDRFPNFQLDTIKEDLTDRKFKIVKEVNISENVMAALRKDGKRKKDLIKQSPKFLRRLLNEFAGIEGFALYNGLESGDLVYYSFLIEKA
jgi:ubiquinone/menaquinone biosynthesis C-methylase UbiE